MTDTDRRDPLYIVSLLNGQYASRTVPPTPHVSETAFMRARVEVEAEYLLALADLNTTPLSFSEIEHAGLQVLYEEFDADDADLVKRLEAEGAADFSAMNHNVKTIEYFIRTETDESVHPRIHFGLTSEDVNNLAQRPMVKGAVEKMLVPELHDIQDELASLAQESRDMPTLA